jgi:hypothetical protein
MARGECGHASAEEIILQFIATGSLDNAIGQKRRASGRLLFGRALADFDGKRRPPCFDSSGEQAKFSKGGSMETAESSGYTRWECKYHLVWIPRCRRKVLYGQLRKHLVSFSFESPL